MNLHIVVNETKPWNPEYYPRGKLRGSEEMVHLFSLEMAKRGHDVTVACTLDGMSKNYDGVRYVSRKCAKLIQREPGAVLLSFKCQEALQYEHYKKRYMWTADPVVLSHIDGLYCDGLFGISEWHENELKGLNWGFSNISHVKPGFSPRNVKIDHKRVKYQCLYASSHDRGLDDLLAMWPKIREAVPEAMLIVTYGDSVTPVTECDGVYFMGSVPDHAMAELYLSSDVLLYPCNGGERYCLTAIKAQYYGAVPCVIPTMVLDETVQFGIKCKKENFANEAIKLLQNDELRDRLRIDARSQLLYATWQQVSDSWESILNDQAQPRNAG